MSGRIEIGRGADATISLDTRSMIVTKTFTDSDPRHAAQLSLREYEYLRRYSVALERLPFLGCPAPIEVDPDLGLIRMEFCPGVPLHRYLANSPNVSDHCITHLGEQIALAAMTFVDEFDEPHFDLVLNNLILDEANHRLSIVDMTVPRVFQGMAPTDCFNSITVGSFLGIALYHSLRPRNFLDRRLHQRITALSLGVLRRLHDHSPICPRVVRRVSWAAYDNATSLERPSRRLWFALAGRLLFAARQRSILKQFGADARGGGAAM